jgi:ribosomal protein L11 methyltransferase
MLAAEVGPLVGGVELRDSGTLLSTETGRTAVIALCKPEDRSMVMTAAHEALGTARQAGVSVDPVVIRERSADESEWRDVWKQFFRATPIGRRFIVRPSWDPGQAQPGQLVIDLDPGRAFGTGAHPSTQLVITLAEELSSDGLAVGRFMDLGCGSGILSIAATRLWPSAAGLAVDNDPEATSCTEENLARNQVGTVSILTGTLDQADGTYDLILANIQADVLCELAALMQQKLAAGGHAILSGILCEQKDTVVASFSAAGFELAIARDEGEWTGLLFRKAASPA